MPHVLEACIDGRQWVEARFLYAESGEHGSAIRIMMEHSSSAFDHDTFLKIIKEVRNQEQFYAGPGVGGERALAACWAQHSAAASTRVIRNLLEAAEERL